jgi:hypothetical protein
MVILKSFFSISTSVTPALAMNLMRSWISLMVMVLGDLVFGRNYGTAVRFPQG